MEGLFEYKIKDEKACITKYLGSSKEVVIPEKIEGYTVTSIGISAFSNNNLSALGQPGEVPWTSVDLSGVESIGSCAFSNNNLSALGQPGEVPWTSVDLSGVESICKYAFYNNLEAIILPEIFGFNEEELDNSNRKYVKKYVDKMRELYMKKLYKNSRKYGLIFEYITYYTYRESYDGMLEEAVALTLH